MLQTVAYQFLPPDKLPDGSYIEAAVIRRTARQIREFVGETLWPHTVSSYGKYGEAWGVGLLSEGGFACRLSVFEKMPGATRLWVRTGDPTVDEGATDLFIYMGLGPDEVLFLWKNVGFHPYAVWRRDDNAHEFLVQECPTKFQAIWVQRDYEAKGHRQTYWVRRASI